MSHGGVLKRIRDARRWQEVSFPIRQHVKRFYKV
jgi:hypothetical protein